MSKFKVGDLVYFPEKYRQVLKVCKNSPNAYDKETYPLNVAGYSITIDGKLKTSKTVSIYLATQENKEKLEAHYDIKLNPALVIKLTSRELVQARLDKGEKSVPCWVSNTEEHPTATDFWVYIKQVDESVEPFVFVDEAEVCWRYATPFDPSTEQPITEQPITELPIKRNN